MSITANFAGIAQATYAAGQTVTTPVTMLGVTAIGSLCDKVQASMTRVGWPATGGACAKLEILRSDDGGATWVTCGSTTDDGTSSAANAIVVANSSRDIANNPTPWTMTTRFKVALTAIQAITTAVAVSGTNAL